MCGKSPSINTPIDYSSQLSSNVNRERMARSEPGMASVLHLPHFMDMIWAEEADSEVHQGAVSDMRSLLSQLRNHLPGPDGHLLRRHHFPRPDGDQLCHHRPPGPVEGGCEERGGDLQDTDSSQHQTPSSSLTARYEH